jgi:hypothetical protein
MHRRNGFGRYTMQFPVKEEIPINLDKSRYGVMKMFLNMKQRLGYNLDLRSVYIEFIKAYIELSHMEKIMETNINSNRFYYLPHYIIVKRTDPEEKIRGIQCFLSHNKLFITQ